jgi:hypothetical protein
MFFVSGNKNLVIFNCHRGDERIIRGNAMAQRIFLYLLRRQVFFDRPCDGVHRVLETGNIRFKQGNPEALQIGIKSGGQRDQTNPSGSEEMIHKAFVKARRRD